MCDSCIPPALSGAEACAAPGTPRAAYSTLALQPCHEPRSVRAPVSPLQCAVEHPKKDASPACPEPRRRERASRPKDLSANVRALECAVEHLAKDASPERASRPKDLSATLTSLECAVTENRPLTPLECAVAKTRPRKSFRMRSYEKRWGEGGVPNVPTFQRSNVPTVFTSSVLLRAFSRSATIGPYSASTEKQSRFFRCLREGERTAGSASARRRARNRKSCLGTSFYVGAQHAVPVRAMGIVG